MNLQGKKRLYPLGALLLGAVGCVLRAGLYLVGTDHKGLLVSGHPLELILWVCTGVCVLLAFLAARQEKKITCYEDAFGPSMTAAFGHILAASGILLTALTGVAGMGLLARIWRLFGLLCAPALYWAGLSRARGKRPFFGTYGVCSLFFALHLVANYQSWCADPQLQNYVFAFLAMLALMMFAYQLCACCVDNGSGKLLGLFGMLAVSLSLIALAMDGRVYLYGGCAAWALGELCSGGPRKKEKAGDADAPA